MLLLIISFFLLSYIGEKQADPDNQNFWVLYFSDPKSENFNFVIENHSDKTDFHWEALADGNKINEGNENIAKGSTWKPRFQVPESDNKKITIVVSSGDVKKEIYKNFKKL